MMQKIQVLCAVGWLLGGCGTDDNPLRQDEVVLQSQVVLKPEEGLEEAVQVDSVHWELGLLNTTVPEEVEIEGLFQIFFRNLAARPVEIRYDLRFLDEDDFLIDNFNPFGQPLRLEADQAREAAGGFIIEMGHVEDLRLVTTMLVVARVRAVQ